MSPAGTSLTHQRFRHAWPRSAWELALRGMNVGHLVIPAKRPMLARHLEN